MQHKWFIEVVISLCPSKCCKIAEFRLSSNCRDHLDPAQAEPSVNDRGQSIPSDGRCPFVVHVQPLPRVDYRSQLGGRCRVEQIFGGMFFFATTANGDAGLHKNSKNISVWFVTSWDSNTVSCLLYCSSFVEPCDGWMLTRAARRSASQESGADHHYLISLGSSLSYV